MIFAWVSGNTNHLKTHGCKDWSEWLQTCAGVRGTNLYELDQNANSEFQKDLNCWRCEYFRRSVRHEKSSKVRCCSDDLETWCNSYSDGMILMQRYRKVDVRIPVEQHAWSWNLETQCHNFSLFGNLLISWYEILFALPVSWLSCLANHFRQRCWR